MSKAQKNWRRVDTMPMLLNLAPGMRTYQKECEDGGHLSLFVGREDIGWHLSISHRTADLQPGRYPTWDEICQARDQFTPPDITMIMVLPPRAEWVNLHNTTFHLWEEKK